MNQTQSDQSIRKPISRLSLTELLVELRQFNPLGGYSRPRNAQERRALEATLRRYRKMEAAR